MSPASAALSVRILRIPGTDIAVTYQAATPAVVMQIAEDTRATASGETAEWSCSVWMTLLAGLLIWLNVIVWGVIGLVTAARVIL